MSLDLDCYLNNDKRLTIFFSKNGIRELISNSDRDSFVLTLTKTHENPHIYLSIADQLLLKYQCRLDLLVFRTSRTIMLNSKPYILIVYITWFMAFTIHFIAALQFCLFNKHRKLTQNSG